MAPSPPRQEFKQPFTRGRVGTRITTLVGCLIIVLSLLKDDKDTSRSLQSSHSLYGYSIGFRVCGYSRQQRASKVYLIGAWLNANVCTSQAP